MRFSWRAVGQGSRVYLEPPLIALFLGLVVANTVGVPTRFVAGLRGELYVKTGIVLLGATVPLTLIVLAGPVAVGQAAIVSIATFGVIYTIAVRVGLDRRFAATLGVGGAVCGASAAIAIAGAVGAKRENTSVTISAVVLWAIAMIFVLPLVSRALLLPTGVAGAWIGTSEFADAAGIAAAQAYGELAGKVPGIGAPDFLGNLVPVSKIRDRFPGGVGDRFGPDGGAVAGRLRPYHGARICRPDQGHADLGLHLLLFQHRPDHAV